MFESDTVRNSRLDALETAVGTSPVLRIYSGSAPADESASLGAATLLAEGTLPSDWMNAASGGAKAKSATAWTVTGQSGAGAGTDGTFWRLYASGGSTSHLQGTFGETADSPEMVADNKNIANGQTLTVSAFTVTAGN